MTLNVRVTDDQLGQYYRRTAAIADRLGKSLDFDTVMQALQRIHDGEFAAREAAMPHEFPVWKTIQIGGKSREQLLQELKAANCGVTSWAEDIMGKEAFTTLSEPESIDLARVEVRELGFTKNPTTAEIWARIRELGHDVCPAEVGPHLRLQFSDQPKGDYFWVAMEAIADSGGDPNIFFVDRLDDGRRWLHADYVRPGDRWSLARRIVFRLRK